MNLMPLVGFYWKHGAQINALFAKGSAGNSTLAVDAATALTPVIKKHWPQLNTDGLCDDALATLKDVLSPPAGTGT